MRDRFPLSRFAELTKGYNLPAIEAEIPVMLKDLGSTRPNFSDLAMSRNSCVRQPRRKSWSTPRGIA
jgi:hypothetical protein